MTIQVKATCEMIVPLSKDLVENSKIKNSYFFFSFSAVDTLLMRVKELNLVSFCLPAIIRLVKFSLLSLSNVKMATCK